MQASRSAVAWTVTGVLGVTTCAVGIGALNSANPATAEPRPAITLTGTPVPSATPTADPSATPGASQTPSASPVAPSPVTPPSPKTADTPD